MYLYRDKGEREAKQVRNITWNLDTTRISGAFQVFPLFFPIFFSEFFLFCLVFVVPPNVCVCVCVCVCLGAAAVLVNMC